MNKKIYRFLSGVVALALIFGSYLSVSAAPGVRDTAFVATGTKTIPQTIVLQPPSWGTGSTSLTGPEINARFATVIMSRGKLQSHLSGYLSAGVSNVYLYLISDGLAGPLGLTSVSAQGLLCTAAQKTQTVYTNSVTMDTGDFCEIHDAIIKHTALADYPDLFPTEAWFLHQADGSRYERDGGMYRPNQGNADWQKYFVRRALRELKSIDPAHAPLAGVDGIYLDNLSASFPQLVTAGGGQPPKEYATNNLYDAAMLSFAKAVSEGIAGYPLIGNINSLNAQWADFAPYLTGGLAESFATNWGAAASTSLLVNELAWADQWLAGGNTLYLVTQGDTAGKYNLFGLSMFLLVYQNGVEYRYADRSSYTDYLEVAEYFNQMGSPLGARVKISDSPIVYKRCYTNASITVDLTNKTSSFGDVCGAAAAATTPVTNTPTATFTPTAQPTLMMNTVEPTATQVVALSTQTSNTATEAVPTTQVASTATQVAPPTQVITTATQVAHPTQISAPSTQVTHPTQVTNPATQIVPPTKSVPATQLAVSAADLISTDGFEGGNFTAWSSSVVDKGDLSVIPGSALVGKNSLQAVIDDRVKIFVNDDRPTAEPRYRARFYFDPNSISMLNKEDFYLFQGYTSASVAVVRVKLAYVNGKYQLMASVLNDNGAWVYSSLFQISDAPHFVELDWQASSSATAKNGHLTFWIDGTQQANLTGIDNDLRRIEKAQLGAVAGLDASTRGTILLDAFESRRLTYIGPVAGTNLATMPGLVNAATPIVTLPSATVTATATIASTQVVVLPSLTPTSLPPTQEPTSIPATPTVAPTETAPVEIPATEIPATPTATAP